MLNALPRIGLPSELNVFWAMDGAKNAFEEINVKNVSEYSFNADS
jgi:hypothetical protein